MAKKQKKSQKILQILKVFTRRSIFILSILFLIGLFIYWWIFKDLPSPQKLASNPYAVSTILYDRNGRFLYEIYADQNRTPVSLDALPQHVIQATVAIEDRNFYKHQGFAVLGISRAVLENVKYIVCQIEFLSCQANLQGGSTITQQLVKNALLTPERTIQRKIKELILTLAVEARYPKDQILEMYLNQIPYGGTAYGLEAASKNYFDKSAKNLTLAEASILAGLPQAPTRYSPFGADPTAYKQRQQAVLRRMVEDGYITQTQSEEVLNTEVTFAEPSDIITAPHFVLWVKELLVEKYGQLQVETGGLRVTTSLDLDLQETAQATVSAQISEISEEYQVSNGAAMITNPGTGEILAMVGSADYFNDDIDGKVNIPLRYRQPGSSIKPLNYTLAFHQHSLSPGNIIADTPICYPSPGEPYCPRNYDGSFHGAVSLRQALSNSYNIPAVKILEKNGVTEFIQFSQRLGITGWDNPQNYGLALTLGGGEVRMLDMTVAYGTLANLGVKVPLHPILKVTDHKNKVLEEFNCQAPDPKVLTESNSQHAFTPDCQATRVIPPGPPYLTTHILSDQNARRPTFGNNLNISGHPEVAVKTGTTNDLKDNWTIGYTPSRLAIVWVGNNDSTPMSRIASGITGAAPIWRDLMTQTLQNQEQIQINPPEGIIGTQICAFNGQLPQDGCPTTFDLFPEESLPTGSDPITRPWPINKQTGLPTSPNDPPELWEMQDKHIVFDINGQAICLNCSNPNPEEQPPQ